GGRVAGRPVADPRVVRRRLRTARCGAGRPDRRVGGHRRPDGDRQRGAGLRPPPALQRRVVGRGRRRGGPPRRRARTTRRARRDRAPRRPRHRGRGPRHRPRRDRAPPGNRRMTDVRLLARRGGELLAALLIAAVVGALTFTGVDALPFVEPSWLPETFGATLAAAVV